VQMLSQAVVVLEPPKARLREEQEVASGLAHRLELRDRLAAVRWMMAGPSAVFGLGEVVRAAFTELEELLVPLAHDEHGGAVRQPLVDDLPDAGRELLVLRVEAALVRLPGLAPLLLEALPVAPQDLAVFARGDELSEGRFPEMVDQHVLQANQPVADSARAHRVVVVLQ